MPLLSLSDFLVAERRAPIPRVVGWARCWIAGILWLADDLALALARDHAESFFLANLNKSKV